MSGADPGNRSAAIAAGVILVVFAVGFVFLPNIMLRLATVSPWLSAVFGVVFVLAFFAVFWLRARYQRRHRR